MGDTLSPSETNPINPGAVVVDVGAGVWKTWANASTLTGCLIGVCAQYTVPGGPIQVITSGRVPYPMFNLGAGSATNVVAGPVPARGGSGQVIGTCDTSGEVFVWPSYVQAGGGNGITSVIGGHAVSGTLPTANQIYTFDGTTWNPSTVVTITVTPSNGDILGYSGGAFTTFHSGASGLFLQSTGTSTLPTWTAAVVPPGSLTTGDVLYYNGSGWSRLAVGSSTQVLGVSGGVPAWVAGTPTGLNMFSPVTLMEALVTNGSSSWSTLSGSQTCGVCFWVTATGHTCTGVRFYWAGSSTNIKCSLWNMKTNARLATTTASSAGTGEHTVTFSAVTLLPGVPYAVTMWDTSGANFTFISGSDNAVANLFGSTYVTHGASQCIFAPVPGANAGTGIFGLYNSGDAAPTSSTGSTYFPVEPVFN